MLRLDGYECPECECPVEGDPPIPRADGTAWHKRLIWCPWCRKWYAVPAKQVEG